MKEKQCFKAQTYVVGDTWYIMFPALLITNWMKGMGFLNEVVE